MALGSTQPLTEMSTRSISWGKGGRCVRLATLPLSCAVVMKSGNLNFLEPSGPLQVCNVTALPFFTLFVRNNVSFIHSKSAISQNYDIHVSYVSHNTSNYIRRYSLFRALASLIRRLHSSLFSALLLHPLIQIPFP
jgi:hypothetical protein